MVRGQQSSGFAIPRPSQFRSSKNYLRAYNDAYVALAGRIFQALPQVEPSAEVRFSDQPRFPTGLYLGWFELHLLAGKDTQRLTHLEVTPRKRSYPKPWLAEKVEKYVTQKQIDNLIRDLQSLGIEPHIMSYNGQEDGVDVSHRIAVDNGKPLEELLLQFHKKPHYYTILDKPEAILDPMALDYPTSIDYKANSILTAFDRTQSGLVIPIGYNRLALLYAVARALESTQPKPKSQMVKKSK